MQFSIVASALAALMATPALACKCIQQDDDVPTPDQNTYNCCNKSGGIATEGDCPIVDIVDDLTKFDQCCKNMWQEGKSDCGP